jgi:transcriptional regulator with GAF, ATPase, and Fis domain
MDLNKVEQQRSGLVQFLVVLLTLILGFILVISWKQDQGYLTQGLTVLGLLTCLYVIAKERSLRHDHDELLRVITEKRHQVSSLGEKLKAEKAGVLKLENRLQELTALYRAISTVNAVTEQSETFEAVLRAALDLVGGDRGSLMLVDSGGQTLSFASAIGLDETLLFGPGPKMGEGVAGWVASNAEPVLITGDAEEDAPYEKMRELDGQMSVAISVPLQLGESVIGVLNLGSTIHADKKQFSRDELRFAYIFAQHAAIAVDRAIVLSGLKKGSGGPLSEELRLSVSTPSPVPATVVDP